MWMIRRLILALILSSLGLCSPPPPAPSVPPGVGPITLKNNNYDETVKNGTWWIKFFSPYCHHCTQFAPTWVELYDKLKQDAAKNEFYFASVDCVEDGDLCDRLNIEAYPSLMIYDHGKKVYEYPPTERTVEALSKFYEKWVKGEVQATMSVGSTAATASATATATGAPKSTSPTLSMSKGESIDLNEDLFKNNVVNSNEPWMVKFHSPRCPHCLEMKGEWTELAKSLRGKMNIGEINCDRQRKICKEFNVDKIPMIVYYDKGATSEYKGLRKFTDMLAFAKSALEAMDIKDIDDTELDQVVRAADAGGQRTGRVTTNFVYFYDDATVYEDFESLRQMAVSVIGNAKVYKTRSKALADRMKVRQYPSLFAVTDLDRWVQFPAKTPKDVRDTDRMIGWAEETWLSQVPQLTPANAREILNHAKYVVLGVVDPKDVDQHEQAIKELKSTAITYLDNAAKQELEDINDQRAKKQKKIDMAVEKGDEKSEDKAKNIKVVAKKKPTVGFAWIDQVFWAQWVQGRYGTDAERKTPRIIINDESGSKYWDVNTRNKYIDVSRSQILDALESIMDPKDNSMRPKALHNGFGGYLVHVKVFWHMYWHWITISALLLLLFRMNKHSRRTNGTYQAPPLDAGKLD